MNKGRERRVPCPAVYFAPTIIIVAVVQEHFVRREVVVEGKVCPHLDRDPCHHFACVRGATAWPAQIAASEYQSSALPAFDAYPSLPHASADGVLAGSMQCCCGWHPSACAGPARWAAFAAADRQSGSAFVSDDATAAPGLVDDDAAWAVRQGWLAGLLFLVGEAPEPCLAQASPLEHREPGREQQLPCSFE
jgi:hypothetical protein